MYVLMVQILVLLSTFGKHFSVTARSVTKRASSKDDSSCLVDGQLYRSGIWFVTCSGSQPMRCYCSTSGLASCMKFCKLDEGCPPGTTLQEVENPDKSGGSRCSCKRQYCVPAKVLCTRREDGQKFEVGETFTSGNCSENCRCDENGQISCSPVCHKLNCPKGKRPRGKGLIELSNGCSCQQQDCVPVPRKFCRMDGRRFRRGRVFITKNCKRKCRCRKNGILRCVPLCKKQQLVPVCRMDERITEVFSFYAGGRCSCPKQVCMSNERDDWKESVVNNRGRKT